MMQRVYLDNAATTPIEPRVADLMCKLLREEYGNPSSIHMEGRKARTIVENARKTIARLLEVAPGEIFFTSCGTEADNMAIRCAVHDLGVTHLITSEIEHHAVLHTTEDCAARNCAELHFVKLTEKGHINYEHLEELLATLPKGKVLVSLMHANNEIGNLLDVQRVGAMCRQFGAYFHTDTVQTIGHLPVKLKEWGVHFAAASAHKFNGPKGVGLLYLSSDVQVKPFISGGAQERNMRGGTENVYFIAGMALALEIAYDEMEQQADNISSLKAYMLSELRAAIPGLVLHGDMEGDSLYTVLNVGIPPSPAGDMLHFSLDLDGIACSGGSACSSGSSVGSHVIRAIGTREGYTPVRFSFGKYNTREDIDLAVKALAELVVEKDNIKVKA